MVNDPPATHAIASVERSSLPTRRLDRLVDELRIAPILSTLLRRCLIPSG
jgi:hypothetical protein